VPASLRRRIGGNPVESVEDDEVYVVLEGSGVLEVAGESLALSRVTRSSSPQAPSTASRRTSSSPCSSSSNVRGSKLAAAAGVLVLAGCGGGSSPPHRHIHLTAFERRGKALFIAKCGFCHTLADAGTTGNVGPVLDSPWERSRVLETIADGPDGMPAELYRGKEAAEVAAYVAAATSAG
jgi:hypothetical protein